MPEPRWSDFHDFEIGVKPLGSSRISLTGESSALRTERDLTPPTWRDLSRIEVRLITKLSVLGAANGRRKARSYVPAPQGC